MKKKTTHFSFLGTISKTFLVIRHKFQTMTVPVWTIKKYIVMSIETLRFAEGFLIRLLKVGASHHS